MLLLTVVTTAPLIPVASAAVDVGGTTPVTETTLAMFAGAVVGAATLTAIVLLFFINALGKNRKLAYEVRDALLLKLAGMERDFRRFASRHNREDDDRFDILVLRQWQTACEAATLAGKPAPTLETFPRRRYLDEETDPGAQVTDVKRAGIAPLADLT